GPGGAFGTAAGSGPARGGAEPVEDLDRRRRAGTVGAEQGDGLIGVDVEVEAIENGLGPVDHSQVRDRNDRHGARGSAGMSRLHRLPLCSPLMICSRDTTYRHSRSQWNRWISLVAWAGMQA